MHSTGSGETYGSAHITERQIWLHDVQQRASQPSPGEKSTSYRFLTISRVVGSLGDRVAEELAHRLGWHVYDREIVDAIAEDSRVRQNLVEELDERSQNLVHDTVQRFLHMAEGHSFGIQEYHEALLKTLALLAARGKAVLVGRGANFVLHGAGCGIHVRITADQDVRIQRMAREWNTTAENARRKLQQTDKDRRDFIRQHFRQNPDDPRFYDAVFRTDVLSVQEVADAVLALLSGFGERPSESRSR